VELGFISLEEFQETCAELQKGMYGNVDAALRFYKTYCNHSQKCGDDKMQSRPMCFCDERGREDSDGKPYSCG